MKCPYCGGEIGDGDKCEFCNSRISYEMKRELEQLNKKGCPSCGSSNVSFTREQEGETWDSNSRRYIRRTVGLCNDCGHTWFTDLPYENSENTIDSSGNTSKDRKEGEDNSPQPPKQTLKTVLLALALILTVIVLLGQCHDDGSDSGGDWGTEGTTSEEGTTEYERELRIMTVNSIENKELEVAKAEIITHTGKMREEDQDDVYSFSPNTNGTYRVELSGIHNNADMMLSIYDSLGERMHYVYAGNGEGLTLTDLEKGKKYKLHVTYEDGLSPYTLLIAKQKKTENITNYSVVKDSIEFTDQDNVYSFAAPLDGVYRFEFSEIHDNKEIMLSIYNDLGERLKYSYAGNNDGITIEFKKGERYDIHVSEEDGFSPYKLKIGKQKEILDISQYDGIKDSIEFTDQNNVYTYTAPGDGEYEFAFSEMSDGTQVCISIYNRLGERLRYGYCGNDDSLTIDELEEGEIYTVHVEYEDGTSPYMMTIQ